MIIVSDTSPIINLAIIGKLDILPALFGKVIILELQKNFTKKS